MIIRPKRAYTLGPGYPRLDPARTYTATPATNQPDHEARGAIFVKDILLERDDYEIVTRSATPERCRQCGGTTIQIAMWVDANTLETFEDYGSADSFDTTWCPECADHTGLEIRSLWNRFCDWSAEFADIAAAEEGWCVFEPDRPPFFEIQRDDDAGMFVDDVAALDHVRERAHYGSRMHRLALAICEDAAREYPDDEPEIDAA